MLDKLPIPTDSLYKFIALTGVILFILPFILVVQVTNSSNETVVRTYFAIDSLHRDPELAKRDSARIVMLRRIRDVATSDRQFALSAAAVVATAGAFMMLYGFREWKRLIQRHSDQIAILEVKLKQTQLDRERYELEILRRQNPLVGSPSNPEL